MSRIVIIGGIESTYLNAQLLHDLGEEIVMFFTRGPESKGWEGVDLVDETKFPFASTVPTTRVDGNINDHVELIQELRPDYIWSLGWQQLFKTKLLSICPVIGIHESLLPQGAGCVPIANAILNDQTETGITLFQVDEGMDTGPIIGQLKGLKSPLTATSTELYQEAIELSADIIKAFLPFLRKGTAPRIPQAMDKRVVYPKIDWKAWSSDKVERARVYPYI